MCSRGRGRSPHTESAIDMQPGAIRVSALADLWDGIESATVHVACLQAHNRAIVDVWKGVEAHPPLCVDGNTHNPVAPKSHERKCFLHARMHFIADHDRERWCSKQSMCLDRKRTRLN